MRQQVTRNDSDEAERSERSPSGVVSAANVEELAAAGGQVSGEAAPANGSASQVNGSSEASGEVRPGEIVHAAGGQALKKALRSHPQMTGNQFVACNGMERYKCMSDCKITCDLKAEMNLRTPRLISDDIGPDK